MKTCPKQTVSNIKDALDSTGRKFDTQRAAEIFVDRCRSISLKEIGDQHSISPSRVSQIYWEVLYTLVKNMTGGKGDVGHILKFKTVVLGYEYAKECGTR